MKIEKEKKIVSLMIDVYYRKKERRGLLDEKEDLLRYVNFRLDHCPFKDNKGFCSKCKIHCYQAPYRQKIKEVMRYSGPRIFFYHPFLVIKHLIRG